MPCHNNVRTLEPEAFRRRRADRVNKTAPDAHRERGAFVRVPQQPALPGKFPDGPAEDRVLGIHVDEDGVVAKEKAENKKIKTE